MTSSHARAKYLPFLAFFLAIFSLRAMGAAPVGACLVALDPTADRAFQIAGATSVYTACGVAVASSASDGFEMEGSETLYLQNHSSVFVVGGALLSGQTYLRDTISNSTVSATKVTSVTDPLATISAPTTGAIVRSSSTYFDMNSKPSGDTLNPGVYCGGLTIGNTNGTNFTFSPGVYILAGGGLTLNSQAKVSGTGVTFYNTSSAGWGCPASSNYTPVMISGQVTATLTAPTSGTYAGILFFGNRNGCSTAGSCIDQINGGSTAILNGAVYFKSDEILISGSNASGYTELVADKVVISGNSSFGTTNNPIDGISVSVSPATSTLLAGQAQQFSATVANTGNNSVTWTISPAVGTVSSGGLYTAPASVTATQTVTITATSTADTSKSGSATITLSPPVTISVSPLTATLYSAQTQQFSATVTGSSNTGVQWSASPAGAGSINASGLYTAPATVSATQVVTITATSAADTAKTATANITLSPPVAVAINPTSATLYGGQAQMFGATVSNTSNTAVTWSISPSGVGSVTNSGVYTAPASVTTSQSVVVKATSVVDSTKSASATVTLSPPVAVTVTPASAILYGGQSQQLAASVTNTSNTAVTWSVSPAVGSVNAAGLYTAPASITTAQTIVVTATSAADSTKSASASISLSVPVTVAVSPGSVSLHANGTQSFLATVGNSSDTSVTWSVSPSGAGSVDANGNFTAPASVTSQQVVSVIVTSVADPTKSASAAVTLIASCAPAGAYSYTRGLVINHTLVPNTDQLNFPVLVTVTDPLLKSTANGGHVASAAGNDLVFSSDSAGTSVLTFELEQYNPATGQLTAWVLLPVVSHTSDATLYLNYGNASATSSQQNPAAVWANGYAAVYHFSATQSASIFDSTSSGNNLTNYGIVPDSGQIGAGGFFTNNVYAQATSTTGLPTGTAARALSLWFRKTSTDANTEEVAGWGNNAYDGSRWAIWASPTQVGLDGRNVGGSTPLAEDGNWHYLVVASPQGNTSPANVQYFVDGVQQPFAASGDGFQTAADQITLGVIPSAVYATQYLGDLDEVRISSVPPSADWVAAEYNNQRYPASFVTVLPEGAFSVTPASTSLGASQSVQLGAAACAAPVVWSLPTGSPGTISQSGTYSAPSSITSSATVVVTATEQANSSATSSAVIHLVMASAQALLSSVDQPPYQAGTTQGFQVTLTAQDGRALIAVPVQLVVAGANPQTLSAITDGNGVASFDYLGVSAGNDTLSATTLSSGTQIQSNALAITWTASSNVSGSVTLLEGPKINLESLVGAFTDANGSVIEPLPIGASPQVFVVPQGATQLQLGVEDDYFEDNHGPGFNVAVNGSQINVPAGAMPWTWVSGGFNASYAFGVQDGKQPVVAATGLVAGQPVTIAYTSGLNSPGGSFAEIYDANGVPQQPAGEGTGTGAATSFGPSHYMGRLAYPVMQPVSISGVVRDTNGNPLANTAVFAVITGANPGQLTGYSDANGNVAFGYSGQNAGVDTVTAQATPNGSMTLGSNQVTVTWVVPSSLPTGTLTLSPGSVPTQPGGGTVPFTVAATDSYGNPVANLPVALNIIGSDGAGNYGTSSIQGTTDSTGHATITYHNTVAGSDTVEASAIINNLTTLSNSVSVTWTPAGASTTTGGTGSLNVSIGSVPDVTLPHTLSLTGNASDSALASGSTITTTWSQLSGPGTITFTNPSQLSTVAFFSLPGDYTLQLAASDPNGSASVQVSVTASPTPGVTQGWIGSPAWGTAVSGFVPITLPSGTTLASGTLSYYPASNPGAVTVLNASASGSGQIGVLDTTKLKNGPYYITLDATDQSGNAQESIAYVTVVGSYKPGRVTTTVTDLVVPAKGIPISIQRSYDSLNASTVGDFGYGWKLSTSIDLTVSPTGDVTFTLAGVRKTFYLTPHASSFVFPFIYPAYTGEPGAHGTLAPSGSGCANSLDVLTQVGSMWTCPGGGFYTPQQYVYTDPNGTAYTMSATGTLQSIIDRTGNAITIGANGITSSTGLSVPFVRDSVGRITQITDTLGNKYTYAYDNAGNLASVNYPSLTNPSSYTYDSNHYYLSGTDFRSNPLPSVTYDANGRMQTVTDAVGNTTRYAYDLNAQTTTITNPADPSGAVGVVVNAYDSQGNLLATTDPLGHTTTNVYDASNNLTSVTDPLGHTTTYTYDVQGNRTSSSYPQVTAGVSTTSTVSYNQYSEPTSTTDELGNVRTFTYDSNYNPQSVTDTVGGSPATLASFQFNADGTLAAGAVGYDLTQAPAQASHFTYDADGNLASKTDALGRTTSYTYDALGHRLTMTEPAQSSGSAGGTTTYTYDAFGRVTQTAAPLGRTTSSTYDQNGNKISDTDARGNTTTYAYDALNRLVATNYPTSPSTTASKTYDFRGNVINETDQAGNITHRVYDLAGRETSVTRGYGSSVANATSTSYFADGRQQTVTDSLGHTTIYGYDAAGRMLSVSGVAASMTYCYDAASNRISSTDGNNNQTHFQYDSRKRLTKIIYPDQTTKSMTYDGPGNLASVTDQANNVVQYTYDSANQLQSVVQVNSPNTSANTTSYTYDGLGNLSSLTDANGHSTSKTYDALSGLTATTLPDGHLTESRTYDAAGNLTSLQHFNGKTTSYSYDSLNRMLSRTPDSSLNEPTVSFTYTATGKYASSTDASGTTTYTYDSLDRLTTKATPEGAINYTYDSAGNVASIASSNINGASMAYTYDSLNRLTTVVDNRLPLGQNTTTYSYDSASNLVTATYPNGTQSAYRYDTLNRVSSVASTPSAGYAYLRGPIGNLSSVTELSGRTARWTYDGIYRLTSETIASDPSGANGTASYGFDPVGNRLSISSTIPGVSSSMATFNADDWLSSESYDANGNVTASGGKTFAYDSENRLVSMNGGAVTLLYDAFGNRVAKNANGTTTRYLVDNLNPTGFSQVLEELQGGTVLRSYTYGLQRIDENQIITTNGTSVWTPSFYVYDGGGTVRQLTNIAGVVTDTFAYDAYGNQISQVGATPDVYLYRGEQWDADLGVYYLRARYYRPQNGRFSTRDTRSSKLPNSQAFHHYLYVNADPVGGVDPTGHDDLIEYRPACCGEEEATEELAREAACSSSKVGAALFGTLVHQYFLAVLVSQTGTSPDDWLMRTAPGQTGVDAEYTGLQELEFHFAELKPVNSPPDIAGCQIQRWGLPEGETRIWWYNKAGIIGETEGVW